MRKIRKGDDVIVLCGKDKGKRGSVIRLVGEDKVLVENVNMVKRHAKPSAQNRQGGIIEGEAPIHWSNLMLMCSKCMTPTRIKMQRLDDGKKVRACSKCEEIIDK